MPFCPKCGYNIFEGSKFCMKCGKSIEYLFANKASTPTAPEAPATPVVPEEPVSEPVIAKAETPVEKPGAVTAPAVQPVSEPTAAPAETPAAAPTGALAASLAIQTQLQQESLAELDRMIKYFGTKQSQYEEYDHCAQNIMRYKDPRTKVNVSGSNGVAQIVIGIFLALFSLPMGLMYIVGAELLYELHLLGSGISDGVVLLFLVGFVAGIILFCVGLSNNKKLKDAKRREKDSMLTRNHRRFEEVTKILNIHYKNFGHCLTGPSYTNPQVLRLLRDIIESGRADTIKESINLLHTDANISATELKASMTNNLLTPSQARNGDNVFYFPAFVFLKKR